MRLCRIESELHLAGWLYHAKRESEGRRLTQWRPYHHHYALIIHLHAHLIELPFGVHSPVDTLLLWRVSTVCRGEQYLVLVLIHLLFIYGEHTSQIPLL